MRIFILFSLSDDNTLQLQVESSDTIGHVKGLIREKEGFIRLDYILQFGYRRLEDSKTLADYNIKNDSTIDLVHKNHNGWGDMHVHIMSASGLIFVIRVAEQDTINDLKTRIEEMMNFPRIEQRLMFCGKELGNGGRTIQDCGIRAGSVIALVQLRGADAALDIAAMQAQRKAALSKGTETGNRAEAEVGSKRAREDSSSSAPGRSQRGSLPCGANHVKAKGMFESKIHRNMTESVTDDCVRMLNLTAFFESQFQEYRDKISRMEKKEDRLLTENRHMKDSLRKEKAIRRELMRDFGVERTTDAVFLQSEVGQRRIVALERQAAKTAVDEFKKSAAMKELVMDRAMSVYEDAVKECQRLLRESGRVSEGIIQLLDPQDEEDRAEGEELTDDSDD